MRTAQTSLRILLAAALLGGAASAPAATLYWDGASVTANAASGGGTGTWTAGATGWEDGTTAVNWTDGDDARFSGTAGTVTLGGNITANSITWNVSGYTLNNGGFNLSVGNWTGANNVTVSGAGTITVTGSSTYTGNLTISAGKFKMSGGQLYNAGYNNANTVTVNSGGTLELDNFGYGQAGSLGQLADYGARRVLNGGTINIVGNTQSAGNNFNVANGSTGFFNMATSGQTLTLSGNGNSNIAVGGTLTFGGAGNITVNEIIDANGSNGSIVYAGTGTLQFGTLQALNSVTTVTARTGGTIRLNNTNAFVSGHGVALAANRSIVAEGTGSIIFGADFRLGNMTLNNGGTFTSNVAVGGYGVLFANNAGGASTVTVSGTYTAAARMNGTGGMNMQGVQNFAVADINTTATDSGQDLIVSMGLGNPNTSGGDVGGITKSGAGTMLLSNSGNTFSGAVTVNAGTLAATGSSGNTNTALGASSGSRTVTVNSGATLAILGNNVFGGGSQTLANTIKVVVNGGTLTTNAYNVIGNVDLNGGTMTATAGSNGSYQTWELNGSTITVGGSAASTISSTAASNGAYHIAGTKTLTLAVADATSSSATDLTVSAVLANGSADRGGAGALLKTGAGTVLLSAANTFTGGFTQRAGTVIASNSSALSTGTVTLGDASTGTSDIALLIDATAGGVTISRDITVAANGSGVVTLGSATTAGSSQAIFSGAITLNRDVTLSGGTNGDRLGFSGAMTGSQNVTIGGTNRVVFTGTAKAYTGTTTINSGAILQLSDGSSTANSFLADSATLTVNGSLRLAKGGNSETVGGLAGSGTVTAIAGADTLIIGSGNATATFSGAITGGGNLSLTKTGTGTQTLTGASTYTGATAVNNGTLALGTGGSLGNTAVTLASGATLTTASGTSIGGSLTVNSGATATLAGSVSGTTTVAGTLGGFGTLGVTNVSANGKLIAGNGVSGSLNLGNLSLAGVATIDIGTFTNYTSTSALTVGTLTANGSAGSVTLNLGGVGAINGSYNLISFTGGTIAGTGLSAFTLATQPTTSSRQTAELQVNGSILQYVVSGATPYWTGLESLSWGTSLVGGQGNWKLDTDDSVTEYEAADAVLFNDLATNTTASIDQADIAPTSILVSGFQDFTFTGPYAITSGLLSKSGVGSLTILNANSFAGGTTLSEGRIRVGTDTALGSGIIALNGGTLSSDSSSARTLANNITVGADATLGDATDTGALTLSGTVGLGGANRTLTIASDATLTGVVSDGALTKAGNGTLTLSGANTFAGGTTLSAGITRAGSATAFGSGAVTVNGGQLDLNSLTLANNVTLTTASLLGSGGISGNLDLGGNAFAPAGNADLTFSGAVSNGSINKTGNGVLTLSGANTYSGGTTLSAGTIRIGSSTAVGNGTLTLGGGRLSSDSTTSRSLSNSVVLTASTTLGDSTLNGALTLSGTLDLGGTTLVLTNDSAVTLSGVVSNGTLRKAGAGTMTLSGANTYTGGTVISGGVLEFATVAEGSASNLGAGTASGGFVSLVDGTLRYTGAGAATSTRNLFIDSGTGTIDVSQSTGTLTLNPAGGTANRAFTKAGSGTLDLGGSLSISGSGNTLTVSGGNLVLRSTHSYTGATTVAAGATLTISSANYAKALATSGITVGSGATLRVTSLNVLYDGAGEIPITVNGGTISLSYSGTGWHQHLGALTLNGGTLTGTATGAPYNNEYSTFDANVTVGGSSRSVIASSQAAYSYALNASGLGRGANVFNVASTGDASGVDLLVSAILSSAGSLRKTGAGVMSLTAGNTYTGGTVVDAGVLELARANSAAGTLAGAITVNDGGTLRLAAQDALGYTVGRGAVTVNAGGTLAINSGVRSTMANSITLNGGSIIGTGNGDTWGHISLYNGSGIVASSDANGNAAVINAIVGLQDSGSLTTFNVSRGSASPVSDLNVTGSLGVMNGSTNGLRKTGTGIMTLSGANTYAGSTTVDNGTLRLASGGRIYSGAYNSTAVVTVNAGATLELQNWSYGENNQSLGGLRNTASALVINGGAIRMAASGSTAYGRGVTVNSGGATFESASGANWRMDGTDGDVAFAYNGNPNLTFTGAGDGTFGKAFSGTGSLAKSGSGTWTLTAASTFSGGVIISAGTLAITDALALGTGGVTVSGGFLDLGGLNPTNLITLSGGQLQNAQNWAPAEVVLGGNVSSETLNAITAPVLTFASGATVDLGGVNKEVVLNGNVTVANLASFTGSLAVAGALDLSSVGNRPSGATIELRSGGTLDFGSTEFTGTVDYKGGAIQGAFSGTVNVAGTGVALDDANIASGKVVVGSGASVDLSDFTGTVRLTGNGGVTAGLPTFSGTLELGAGSTLNLTTLGGSLDNATVTVDDGATMRGTGTVGDTTLASGGALAPGNSPGTLTYTNLALQGGASIDIEIAETGGGLYLPTPGVSHDNLVVNGLLDISGLSAGNTLTLNLISLIADGSQAGDLGDFDPSGTYAFDLFTYGQISAYEGSISQYFTLDGTALTFNGAPVDMQFWSLVDTVNGNGDNVIRLQYAPIPEPSTYGLVLGGLALAGAAIRRRRAKRS